MFNIFIGIMLFQLGGLILPGPDFAVVFRHSVIKGKKEGLLCASGVAIGVMFGLLLTYFIGTALYTKYHFLYICFISIGILFLYHISWSLVRNFFILRKKPKNNTADEELSTVTLKGNSLLTGLFTNLSNAKAIVFFSTLLPLVNRLDLKYTIFTWIGLGCMTLSWFSFVAFMFTQSKIRHAFLAKIHIIELFIGIAIFLFASGIFYATVFKYLVGF